MGLAYLWTASADLIGTFNDSGFAGVPLLIHADIYTKTGYGLI